MAVIQKMRDKAGLMVVIIGIAMVLFLLGDLLTSASSFSEDYSVAGMVGDYEIGTEEYSNYTGNQNASTDKQREDIHEKAWGEFVQRNIYKHIFDNVNLSFSEDERNHLLYENVHPQVYSAAMQIDQSFNGRYGIQYGVGGGAIRNMISEASQNPQISSYWDNFANYSLMDVRKKEKYNNLVKYGMFDTQLMAKQADVNNNRKYKVSFVHQSSNVIEEADVNISDDEMKAYYNNNLAEFETEATRDVKYVEFRINADAQDINDTKEALLSYASEMKGMTAERRASYSQNIDRNQDIMFYSKEELADKGIENLFEDENAIVGPVRSGSKWTLYTPAKKEMISDSVKASHILITWQGLQNAGPQETKTKAQAKAMADSLLAVFEKDSAGFAKSAIALSKDLGSGAKGGNLGWFGQGRMVPSFNDACFLAKKRGEVKLVESRFGFHVILVQKQSKKSEKVRFAKIDREIRASKRTIGTYSLKASRFARGLENLADFEAAILNDPSLFNSNKKGLTPMSFEVIGLNNPRNMVIWAFQNEVGAVSTPFSFGNSFVVAAVSGASSDKHIAFEDAKDLIKAKLMDKARAEALQSKMKAELSKSNTLETLAAAFQLTVETDNAASFESTGLNRVYSGEILGRLEKAAKGEVCGPFVAGNEVFAFRVDEVIAEADDANLDDDISKWNQMSRKHASSKLLEAYEELLEVEDHREKVFVAKK